MGLRSSLQKGTLRALLFVALSGTVVEGVAAQANVRSLKWFLKDQTAGLCVDFLISPLMAAEHLGAAGTPIPVERLADRYPALARAARAETAYNGWIPGQYCWFMYANAIAAGRTVRVDDGRLPVVVGYLAIEASGLQDGATAWMSTFFTNSGTLSGHADRAFLPLERIAFSVRPIPTQEDDTTRLRYEARNGRSTVIWEGGVGAARPAMEPRTIHLIGIHPEGGVRHVRTTITAAEVFAPSGSISVSGAGMVAELLSSSPIRMVSWVIKGTDADWEISH